MKQSLLRGNCWTRLAWRRWSSSWLKANKRESSRRLGLRLKHGQSRSVETLPKNLCWPKINDGAPASRSCNRLNKGLKRRDGYARTKTALWSTPEPQSLPATSTPRPRRWQRDYTRPSRDNQTWPSSIPTPKTPASARLPLPSRN